VPGSRRIVICMSDADVARRMRMHETKEWRRRLAAMPNIGATIEKSEIAQTSSLVPPHHDGSSR
jgi:hypothetical protein